MKRRLLMTMVLMGFALSCCTDHKAETADAVKRLEEYFILKPSRDEDFYSIFRRYQNGDAEIGDFPFLPYLLSKSDVNKTVPESVLKAFIDAGADVNVENEEGVTPLHVASVKGQTAAVKALLAAGAKVNAKDENGWTPLHVAANEEIVKDLIAAGANVNAKDGWRGYTPLHVAEDLKIVKVLIAKGANVNARDEKGNAPLHLRASAKEQTKAAKALIAAGANVNAKNERGRTPLHVASENGRTRTVKVLLSAGADVNAKDERGKTPLYYAEGSEIEDILRSAGADE